MRDDVLAAILQGDGTAWSGLGQSWTGEAFFRAADWHGIIPLLADSVSSSTDDACPAAIREELQSRAERHAAREYRVRAELCRVFAELSAFGVRPIVFKGTALAYTHYREPWLRSRLDTDVLIPAAQFLLVKDLLLSLGYTREPPLGCGAGGRQAAFTRIEPDGFVNALDIHWDVTNRPALADVVSYDELVDHAEPCPALHSTALSPDAADALILASIHRVAHHDNTVRLIWLYDIALLVRCLGVSVTTEFRRLTEERHVAALCADAVCLATARWQDLKALEQWASEWRTEAVARREPSSVYLTRTPWRGDMAISDFLSARNWRARLRFLAALVVPDSAYMLTRYHEHRRWLLPALHAHRLLVGTWNLSGRLARHWPVGVRPAKQGPLSLSAKVRVPVGVLVTELHGQRVLLNLDTDSAHGLDQVGARFWEMLTASQSIQHACDQLQAQFDVDPDALRSDLTDLILGLEGKGLIEVEHVH